MPPSHPTLPSEADAESAVTVIASCGPLSEEAEAQPQPSDAGKVPRATEAAGARPGVQYRIAPEMVAAVLLVVVSGLALSSTLARMAIVSVGPDQYRGLMEIATRFDLDHEINIPTWYSSISLMCCGFLLAMIAVARRQAGARYVVHWGILALAFVYLSVDETAVLHEILIVPLRRRLGTHGFLYFAWVIPASVCVLAFAMAYVRFLLHLPRRTARWFVLAGALYVGGALGVELIGGACADWYGFTSMRYLLAMTAEEVLEMLGIVVFIYALLDYIRAHVGPCRVAVA